MAAIILAIVIIVEALLLISWGIIHIEAWIRYTPEQMRDWQSPAPGSSTILALDPDFEAESKRLRHDYMEVIMNLTEETDGEDEEGSVPQ